MYTVNRKALEETTSILLNETIPASVAFCSQGTEYIVRTLAGEALTAPEPLALSLLRARNINEAKLEASARRAFYTQELYSESDQANRQSNGQAERLGSDRSVLVVLNDSSQTPRAFAGLERLPHQPPFTTRDLAQLDAVVPYLIKTAAIRTRTHSLERELAALRALSPCTGTILLVDRERREVTTIRSKKGSGLPPRFGEDLLTWLDEMLQRGLPPSEDSAVPMTPLPFAKAAVTRIVPLEDKVASAKSSAPRWLALSLVLEKERVVDTLSKRESEVAHMLASGYTAVNIAATYGISENTVRTYMRRLYRKLDVNNRADLVRQLLHRSP